MLDIAPAVGWDISSIVDDLHAVRRKTRRLQDGEVRKSPLPSGRKLADIVADITAALFPRHAGAFDHSASGLAYYSGARLNRALWSLVEQIENEHAFEDETRAAHANSRTPLEIVSGFASSLPQIYEKLERDVQAAFEGDPSAKSTEEVLLSFPGIRAVTHHRIAHALHTLGAPIVARVIASLAHSSTGIDIHPGAAIGGSFFIDHGTGVVIGETTVIGEHVRIYQAVTLGAKRFSTDENGSLVKGEPRHPIVEDNVVIYAGATILGRVTIGRNSSIGGNVWLTRSVPPHSNIVQAQARSETFGEGGGI